MGIVKRPMMIPVADDTRSKDHKRNEREGYSEKANCFACRHFRKPDQSWVAPRRLMVFWYYTCKTSPGLATIS